MRSKAIGRIILWTLVVTALSSTLIVSLSRHSLRNMPLRHPAPRDADAMLAASPDGAIALSPEGIRELKVEWLAGDILIQPGKTDRIMIRETGSFEEEHAMVVKQHRDTLKVNFCIYSVHDYFSLHIHKDIRKDLTITVPADWLPESLEVECASAAIEIRDLTVGEVDFDGASGTCVFTDCTVGTLDVDTASGDIRFQGQLTELDCDAVSADVSASLTNVPQKMDLDSVSGDLELILPEDAGFSLTMDALSTNFDTDFDVSFRNDRYVCGDGRCEIEVDALSGDVVIRKASH